MGWSVLLSLAPPPLGRRDLLDGCAVLSAPAALSSSDLRIALTPARRPSPPGVVKRSFVSGDCGKFLPSSLPLLIGSVFDCQQMEGQFSETKAPRSELFP